MKRGLRNIYDRLYECYGPQGWWPGRTRFEIIVGAILTQNTAWTNVEKAIRNLRAAGVLTPAKMQRLGSKRLATLIRPAGYYNIKTKRLKSFLNFLDDKYEGSLDRMSRLDTKLLRRELLGVHGIGPETCDSILLYAFNRPVFVVDAYTKRVFSRHAFFSENAAYDEVQALFMGALPVRAELFNEYHALVVKLAKECCRKVPKCEECPVKACK